MAGFWNPAGHVPTARSSPRGSFRSAAGLVGRGSEDASVLSGYCANEVVRLRISRFSYPELYHNDSRLFLTEGVGYQFRSCKNIWASLPSGTCAKTSSMLSLPDGGRSMLMPYS